MSQTHNVLNEKSSLIQKPYDFTLSEIILLLLNMHNSPIVKTQKLFSELFLIINEVFYEVKVEPISDLEISKNQLISEKLEYLVEHLIFANLISITLNKNHEPKFVITQNGKEFVSHLSDKVKSDMRQKIKEKISNWEGQESYTLQKYILDNHFDGSSEQSIRLRNILTGKILSSTFGSLSSDNAALPTKKITYSKIIPYRGKIEDFAGRRNERNKIKKLLNTSQHVSIRGESGTGKTQIAYKTIEDVEENYDYVIMIYLDEYTSFLDFCNDLFENIDVPANLTFDKKLTYSLNQMSNYNTLLFCDNYEVIEDTNLEKNRIHSFLTEIPKKTSVLLASQKLIKIFDNEEVCELRPLNEKSSVSFFNELIQKDENNYKKQEISNDILSILPNKVHAYPLSLLVKSSRFTRKSKSFEKIIQKSQNKDYSIKLDECVKYASSNLSDKERQVLYNLTNFQSCFPLGVATDYLNIDSSIIQKLHDYGLILRMDGSDKEIEEKYRLYDFHPRIKKAILKENISSIEDEKKLFHIYHKFLSDLKASLYQGKSFSRQRFKILFDKNNDIEEILEKYNSHESYSSYCNLLGIILRKIGLYQRSLEYHMKALKTDEQNKNKILIARDQYHIGQLHALLGSFNKSFKILNESIKLNLNNLGQDSLNRKEKTTIQERISNAFRYLGLTYRDNGKYDESLTCFDNALKYDGSEKNKARIFRFKGTTYRNKGDFITALKFLRNAVSIDVKLNNQVNEIADKRNIAVTYRLMGKFKDACSILWECIEKDIKIENKNGLARNYLNLGMALNELGYGNKAISYVLEAINIDKKLGVEDNLARDYINLGIVHRDAGNLDSALDCLKIGLNLHKKLGNPFGIAFGLHYIGITLRDKGQYTKSIAEFKNSAKINRKIDNKILLASNYRHESIAYRDLAVLKKMMNKIEKLSRTSNPKKETYFFDDESPEIKKLYRSSKTSFNKIQKLSKDNESEFNRLKDYYNWGIMSRHVKKYNDALLFLNKALTISKYLNNEIGQCRIYRHIGIIYRELKEYNKSMKYLYQAQDIAKKFNDEINQSKIECQMGINNMELGKYVESEKLLLRSSKVFQKLGYEGDLFQNHYYLALLHLIRNKKNGFTKYVQILKAQNVKLGMK